MAYQVVGNRLDYCGLMVIAKAESRELAAEILIAAAKSGVWYALEIVEEQAEEECSDGI